LFLPKGDQIEGIWVDGSTEFISDLQKSGRPVENLKVEREPLDRLSDLPQGWRASTGSWEKESSIRVSGFMGAALVFTARVV